MYYILLILLKESHLAFKCAISLMPLLLDGFMSTLNPESLDDRGFFWFGVWPASVPGRETITGECSQRSGGRGGICRPSLASATPPRRKNECGHLRHLSV